MTRTKIWKSVLAGSACVAAISSGAFAAEFDIPSGDLNGALSAFSAQSGVQLVMSYDAVKGARSRGVKGDLSADEALSRILAKTGFSMQLRASGAVAIVPERPSPRVETSSPVRTLAATSASAVAAGIESVVVTSSKIKGDIQTVPIAITALSQEQLTSRQIAGGPDLVKEVPNLTFSKTNFTGYNIQIRGIGTQAISVTTDPAVAVAFNDMPFIRNHFFEQEFYDVGQVEVLRGPQGTLYGRNATAGVVNVVSAKPTDQFEAMLSADVGNFRSRRYEAMINISILDDRFDMRAAAEWTKRDGYSFNDTTHQPIDGRDLWSSRITAGWKPLANLQTYLIWEHFQENDDRIRSSKQLCKRDDGPDDIYGVPIDVVGNGNIPSYRNELSQGCLPASLYSPDSFQTPDGLSLPYIAASAFIGMFDNTKDPYSSRVQSRDLRAIESTLDPTYRAKNDIFEVNTDYALTPQMTLTSQTGFNHDFLYSAEDYNRFNTASGIFVPSGPADPYPRAPGQQASTFSHRGQISDEGVFCDPQLGCADRVVGEDLSEEHSWQFSQEFRLASNFDGPLNFSAGINYLHYETDENYYVFINSLTMISTIKLFDILPPYVGGVSDNSECLKGFFYSVEKEALGCTYIDPNPIDSLNRNGHNYFLSQNPYVLNSYAGFGEAYFNITNDLKLTGGLRWTDDRKHFGLIPSEVLLPGWGYRPSGAIDQKWGELTGRFNATWTPKLDFTDQTLVYGSFAHGYKAGGANPPGAAFIVFADGDVASPTHPLTFKPEFVNAFEAGTKNTLLDGALTLNANAFYYDYKAYQISQIVDRTSVNLNFDATVKGAEMEATWEPSPGLKFSFAGGYEDTAIGKGQQAIDLIDRTAGHAGWMVVKPAVTQASNCILPTYVVARGIPQGTGVGYIGCGLAYNLHEDPLTALPYVPNPTESPISVWGGLEGYPGFDPLSVDPSAPADINDGLGLPPNNGEGFDKNVGGNELPNAPHFTTALTGEYTLPVSEDWAATLHSDFYWQSQSFARVFNDRPYDKIRGYSNVNLALILTSANGWQILGYLKNIFDTTAITGDFLNSDDTGLTTNVFLTDPRLFGVRVTKNF